MYGSTIQSEPCGHYSVVERTVFRDAGFETAAWWQEIAVEPGSYPVYVSVLDGCLGWFTVKLPGVIVKDNFQDFFGGMPIGKSYDTHQNAGKHATYHVRARAYDVLAEVARNGSSAWTLDFDVLPPLALCSDCGCRRTSALPGRCPACEVRRGRVAVATVEARHGWLLDAAHFCSRSPFSSILNHAIARHIDSERSDAYWRGQISRTVSELRALGPQGRRALYGRYSPRVSSTTHAAAA